ncbi:MAG: hypothetical protein OQK82_05065 [Candidatus Pacearchaeota archaeon]|nr:hypothetical protein [Candidatus Pacearchaeota archaeon]
MNLQVKEIKILFDNGGLKKCDIVENSDLYEQGFVCWFTAKNGGQISIRTQRSAERIKTYKNLQSAVNVAKDIGFREIGLKLIK